MARRKSLNRRLSRYSRNSTGSAFLDPDTENLGDEQPYWWKNLENNTVMRPSMSYNTPNQTSPILDPNSRVDSGQLQDGWWKVLDTTDIADDAKLTMPTRKPDADNNTVTTLESDEEPIITKRKVILRSEPAARKLRGNPFVNISESETSDEKITGESPMNKSGSIDKGTTSSKRLNKLSESSSGQSLSTDVVLKSKPTLFKKRHKDRRRNVFDDVLKENELLTPRKSKSLKLSSHSTELLMENKIPAITESPIVKQGRTTQLVLSFENDQDLSRLPNPEAQSTLLESSSSTHCSNKDNSEMEARVLKPKSRFLKRRKRGADRNVFADILAEEEVHNDVEISKWKEKGIDANAEASKTCSVGQAGGSLRGSQTTPSNVVNEIGADDAKARKGSISTEAITPSAQDPRGPVESNTSAQASIASSDTSDKSQDPNTFLKPRSAFLKRSRKRPETNIFQEILEEDDNVDALGRSTSDTPIDRTKGGLVMKDQATVARETRRRRTIDQDSNTSSEEIHLELATSSQEDGNNAKETSEMYRSTGSDIDISELGSDPKERRQCRSASNVSSEIPKMSYLRIASLPRIINEVNKSGGSGTWNVMHREAASGVDALERSRSDIPIDRTKEDLTMKNQTTRETRGRGIIDQESNTGSEQIHLELASSSQEDGNNAKETSEMYRSTGSDIDISELGLDPKERRQCRSASHVSLEIAEMSNGRNASLSRIINEASKSGGRGTWNVRHQESASDVDVSVTSKHEEGNHTQSDSRNQHERDVLEENKGSSQKLYTQLLIDTSDDSDQESKVIERTRRKGTNKLGNPSFRSIVDDSEPDDLQRSPRRPSKKLRTSMRQSTVVTHRDTDLEPVLSTSRRQSKSLNKSQKLLTSRVLNESETENVQETPNRQSKSLSKSQKLLRSRIISEHEAEEVQATSKRQSKSLIKSLKLLRSRIISEDEAEEVQATSKRQSESLSKSQKLLRSRIISEDEAEEVQATSKRQSESLSKSQKLLRSRIISEDEAEEVRATSKRQSKSLSKSQKLLRSRIISEDEAEEVQATSKRQSESLSKSQKLLHSRVMSEEEAEEVPATSKRQSEILTKSQKLLSSRVMTEYEAEGVQESPKRQSKSLNKSQKFLHSRVISEDEAEEVPATSERQSKSLSKSQKLLSSRVMSKDEAEDVQETPKGQSKSLNKSQKLLSSRVMSEDETEDVQETPKRQSKSLSKSQKFLHSRVIRQDEAEEVPATSKRQSKSLSKSQKFLRSRIISEDEAEEVQATSKRQSKSLSKSQKLLRSRIISEDEAEEVQATSKRQSKSLSKSQKLLSSRVMSESETENAQETTKKQSKSLSKSQKLLSSRVISENEAEEVPATSKRQSNSLSKSQRLLHSRVMSEEGAEEVPATSKRQSKSLTKSQKLLSSRVMSKDEAEDVQETPKGQSKSLNKSQELLSSRVMSEDETEDVQETPKRQSKSLNKSQKLLSSRVISEDEAEEVPATSKRQSNSLSKSQRLLHSRVMSEEEAEEVPATSERQSKRLSKSQKLLSSSLMSESETEDTPETTKKQSKSLSKSQKFLHSRVISEDEAEEVPATSKRQSKSLNKSQKLLSSRVISGDEAEEVPATSKRQSKSLSKSQRLLHSRVMSEKEAEEVPATSKRQSKILSKSQKLLSSRVMTEYEAEGVQESPKRQSKSLNKSQKFLHLRVISEDEAEEVPATSKRQSRSLSKSQKLLSSRVMSKDEAEDVQETPKRQSKSLSTSQRLLLSRVMSEDEAEEIQSPRKARESKSVGKAQKRSTSNAIKEFESEDPNTPEKRSKVLSKLPNDISSAANQIEPCEIDGVAKRQSKSISSLERQLTVRIVKLPETKEVEINRQKHSRNFMSRGPSVSPARGESQLTVPITGKSTMHRVQEEEEEEEGAEEEEEVEEEEAGIDAGAKSFSATRRSEQQIAFNSNVTKDREDEDLLNASSKNAKDAKEVSRNDTGRNVGKNRSVALGRPKGSVGPTRTSTNRGKDLSRSQRNIEDFLIPREVVPASQVFADKEKAEKFKRELEKIKKQAMDDMKLSGNSQKSKLPLPQKKPSNLVKTAKETEKQRPVKPIHKAFLVNGHVYRVPRLPRPKYWVTDRLYKYLWKQLEPKYALQTRVISEKFVQQLSNVTSFIVKQKSYRNYRAELYALIKEMARLGIIRTRYEFYTFCQEFFPYELRIKVVPMLLPGNKRNIPYEKNKLNEPLLRS